MSRRTNQQIQDALSIHQRLPVEAHLTDPHEIERLVNLAWERIILERSCAPEEGSVKTYCAYADRLGKFGGGKPFADFMQGRVRFVELISASTASRGTAAVYRSAARMVIVGRLFKSVREDNSADRGVNIWRLFRALKQVPALARLARSPSDLLPSLRRSLREWRGSRAVARR